MSPLAKFGMKKEGIYMAIFDRSKKFFLRERGFNTTITVIIIIFFKNGERNNKKERIYDKYFIDTNNEQTDEILPKLDKFESQINVLRDDLISS